MDKQDETIKDKAEKKVVARPYADLKNPFIVDEKGAFAEYILQDPETMPELALGSTITIEDKRDSNIFWISGSVAGLRAVSPFNPDRENLLYIEDNETDPTKVLTEVKGPHTHQPMLIRVELNQEMHPVDSSNRNFNSVPVQRPPSAASHLFFPNILPKESDSSPSLKEILEIQDAGIPLGNVGFGNSPYEQDGSFLTYKWNINDLDNKHIYIIGESGSGKTVLLKGMALQIRKHNKKMRVILTDVQGDIIQLLVPDVADTIKPKGWQAKIERESVQDAVKTLGPFQLIIPVVKNFQSDNAIALKKLAQNRGVIVREIGLRLQDLNSPSDVEYLYRVQSEQVAMLLDEEAQEIDKVTISRLRDRMNELLAQQENQVTSRGGTQYYKSTCYAAKRALKNLESYFDHHQASMSLSNNPLDYFNFDGTTILFLEHLNHEERIMWEMQLVKWLYEHKRDGWEAFVFIDEAHQVVPATTPGIGSKGTFDRLRNNFERLAREGRKFGINLVLSTQSPKDLHEIVPEQCPTRIVMKINPKNASYAFVEKELAYIANKFGHGQFWLQSPFNGTPNWVRIHSWAPPLPHEPMTRFWEKVKNRAQEEN